MNKENHNLQWSDLSNNQLLLLTEFDPLYSEFSGNGSGTGDISVRIVEEIPPIAPAPAPEAIEIAPANQTSSSDIDVGADADSLIGDRGTGEFDALTNQQSTADEPVNLLGWSFNVVPEALDFGESIEMELVVENADSGDAGTFDVAFYMSGDDRFDSEDYYFGNLTVDGLAGDSKTELLAISFVLPAATDPYWDTVGDVVTIGMVVDIANAIAETDEYDNVRVLSEVDAETVAIAPVDPDPDPDPDPDVVNLSGLSFDVVPDSLRTGDRFDAELQVQNTGNSEVGEFPISLYISADEIITTADLLLDDLIVSSLAGNSSSDTLTVSLILPDASDPFWTDAGENFFIGAIADPANIIPETDETDNANLGEAIDYEGIQITQPSEPEEPEEPTDPTEDDNVNLSGMYLNVVQEPLEFGDALGLEFVVGNTEAGEAENVPVTFYLSRDEIIDASDYNFGSYTIDLLAGNSNTEFLTTNVTLPGSEDPFWNGEGYYYVLMGVDVDNRISETNEGDNSNTGELIDWDGVEITDPNKIDLSAVAFNVVQEPLSAGDSFDVEYQIQNTENLDAGEFLVNLYLSADGTIDSDDLLLGSETISGLAGNSQTDLLTGSYSLPAADHAIWVDGDFFTIGMMVDAANGVTESNEDNNANLEEYVDADSVQITLPIEEAPVEPVEPPTRYNFPRENQPAIGIIDTGFAADNPDLDYSRLVLGRDRIDNDNDPLLTGSGDEHGTHVLGIVGATQDNGIGIDGVNDDAPIWLGRAVDSGEWAASLTEFVDYARSSGQPHAIANISFDLTQVNRNGSVTTRYELTPEERQALGYARQHGVLIVVAAGNDGGVMSVLGQASQEFDNIITVGAADGSNRAVYSSYGNGLNILAGGGTTENPVLSLVGDGVGTMAGTSVAAAQVTGAASLVWAANPDLNYRQVIEAITASATDLQASGWDAETGAGLLNVDEAVETAENMRGTTYNPEAFLVPTTWGGEGEVTPGERAVQSVSVSNTSWRTIYSGWLNSSNPEDKFNFYLSRTTPLQLALKFPGSIKLTGPGVNVSRRSWNNNDIFYDAGYLRRGSYTLTVGLGSRSSVEPYELILNFIPGSVGQETPNRVTLPRPVVDTDGERSDARYIGYLDNDSYSRRDSIGGGDDNDYYRFRLDYDSDFELDLTNLRSDADVQVLSSSGRTIFSSRRGGSSSESIDGSLSSGTYYARVYNYGSNTSYNINLSATTSDPDGERWKATRIPGALNGGSARFNDSIGYNGDRYDYYRFYISNSSDFELSLTGMRDDANVRLLNSSGSYITSSTRNGSSNEYISRSLSSGTYYVRVEPDNSYDRTSYTLNMSATDNSIRINGYTVEGDFFPVFNDNRSRLNNPTSNALYSSGNRYQSFQKGMIAQSQYGTLPVYGDIYQEYNSLGGVSSWLGVPRVGQLQQGNGFVKQDFQNGYVIWNGVNSVAYQVGSGTSSWNDLGNPTFTGGSRLIVEDNDTNAPFAVSSYTSQDESGTWQVEGGGNTLRLEGNNWKKLSLGYNVTPDTILEFDFNSTSQGELQGIGFDVDDDINNNSGTLFKLYGTQHWNSSWYDNYTGSGWKHYEIPVGRFLNGYQNYLVFANDHDVDNPTARSFFRNIKVYEDTARPVTLPVVESVNLWNEWKGEVAEWNGNINDKPPGYLGKATENLIGTINLGSNGDGLHFDWGTGSPKGNSRLPNDHFVIKASTYADFSADKDYIFKAKGDDGFRLFARPVNSQGNPTNDWEMITPVTENLASDPNGYQFWQQEYWQSKDYSFQPEQTSKYEVVSLVYEKQGDARFDLTWKVDSGVTSQINQVYRNYESALGAATSGVETHYSGAKYKEFENGLIVSSSHGTYPVWWGIEDAYSHKYGGLGGRLGAPTGVEEEIVPNSRVKQTFANGYIEWLNGSTTAYNHNGSLMYPPPPSRSPVTGGDPLQGFIHPLDGDGVVSQGPNGSFSHTGRSQYAIDYAVDIGTPVYAMRSGRVSQIIDNFPDTGGDESNKLKANLISIIHEDGYRSGYLHLQQEFNSRVGLKVGDPVDAGDLIGYSGNSGWSTGPHLHVEVHRPNADGGWGQTVPFEIGLGKLSHVDISITPIDGGDDIGTTPIDGGDNISLAGKINAHDGEYDVRFWPYGPNGVIQDNFNIDNNKDTVIVIHGRTWKNEDDGGSNPGLPGNPMHGLARTLADTTPNAQVLALDWREAARDSGQPPRKAAGRILPVATWAADELKKLGINDPDKISIVGHSLGTYVAAEMGKQLNNVENLVALDPAYPAASYNINWPTHVTNWSWTGVTNFRDAAQYSVAFVVSDTHLAAATAGDNVQAEKAHDSFLVEFNRTGIHPDLINTNGVLHSGVTWTFIDILKKGWLGEDWREFKLPNHIDGSYTNTGVAVVGGSSNALHEGVIIAEEANYIDWNGDETEWRVSQLTTVVGRREPFDLGIEVPLPKEETHWIS